MPCFFPVSKKTFLTLIAQNTFNNEYYPVTLPQGHFARFKLSVITEVAFCVTNEMPENMTLCYWLNNKVELLGLYNNNGNSSKLVSFVISKRYASK